MRTTVMMLKDVGVYFTVFEHLFLQHTEVFYKEESARLINELEVVMTREVE